MGRTGLLLLVDLEVKVVGEDGLNICLTIAKEVAIARHSFQGKEDEMDTNGMVTMVKSNVKGNVEVWGNGFEFIRYKLANMGWLIFDKLKERLGGKEESPWGNGEFFYDGIKKGGEGMGSEGGKMSSLKKGLWLDGSLFKGKWHLLLATTGGDGGGGELFGKIFDSLVGWQKGGFVSCGHGEIGIWQRPLRSAARE